ncbi:MAG: hypothetical protein ACREI2_00570 [Nitrospiraceae bacterium]
MPEVKQVTFTFKEIVEALLKKHGIHEGIWGIYIEFAIQGTNLESPTGVHPAAIVPVLKIGLQRMDKVTPISVDAAEVNPPPSR